MKRLGIMRCLLASLILASFGSTEPAKCQETAVRLLVPAYGNPDPNNATGSAMWTQLIESAAVLGPDLLVILNPNSGPGGGLIDPNYVNNSAEGPFIDFRNAGGVAIGYVRTQWATRSLSEVQSEVDEYYDPAYWRGAGVQIQGIFFDEMSTDLADVGYYQTLRDYVRSFPQTDYVVGNPGTTSVDTSGQSPYTVSDYAETADILVTFETLAEEYFNNYTPPVWLDSYPAERFAHIAYKLEGGVSQMLQAVALARNRKAGYIYFTDDHMTGEFLNPYDELASFWSAEIEAAQGLIFANGFESGNTTQWSNTQP